MGHHHGGWGRLIRQDLPSPAGESLQLEREAGMYSRGFVR